MTGSTVVAGEEVRTCTLSLLIAGEYFVLTISCVIQMRSGKPIKGRAGEEVKGREREEKRRIPIEKSLI